MKNNKALMNIQFDNDQMSVVEHDGKHFVAMKPIAEVLGLDWRAQIQLLKRDPVLDRTICIIQIVAEDGKLREMFCLPLQYLNGWLFKINADRYTGERREKIIRYQKECYQVLFDHFFGKYQRHPAHGSAPGNHEKGAPLSD